MMVGFDGMAPSFEAECKTVNDTIKIISAFTSAQCWDSINHCITFSVFILSYDLASYV